MSWRSVAVVGVSLVVVAGAAGAALYAVQAGTAQPQAKVASVVPRAAAGPAWDPAAAVLEPVAQDATAETAGDEGIAAELAGLVESSALGSQVAAAVVELGTGQTLLESNATEPAIPASTMKILTSAAALEVLGPDHRFVTRVVATEPLEGAAEPEIILVGSGDPLLASTSAAVPVPSAASLEALAESTAEALAHHDVSNVRVTFDDGLFSGPAVDPDWKPSYVPGGVVGPISALAVDGARRQPGLRARVDEPARVSAELFVELLEDRDISVPGGTPQRADASGDNEIASVASPPLSTIVEYVLRTSDNDVAEVLARQVAVGRELPGSEAEAGDAVLATLDELGVDTTGVRVQDGSGLARGNAVTVSSLVAVLSLAADPDLPHLRPILTGMPVAGFSGTLADRVAGDSAGYVRAKTGTLTGVHSLAGLAVSGDGQVYVFAVLADDADDALAARAALDEFAAALVS